MRPGYHHNWAFACVLALVAHIPGAAAVATVQPTSEPGQVDLRPRFVQGQSSKFELQIASKSKLSSAEVPELDQQQAMKQTLRLSLKVVETGPEETTLEMVYDAAKISFESDDFTAEYDSSRPPPGTPSPGGTPSPTTDPDPAKILESLVKGMVGAKLTLKVDPAGNITSVAGDGGLSRMSKSFIQSVGGGLPGAGGLPSSGDTAKWVVSGPRGTGLARIGETWTHDDELGGTPLGDFRMRTAHTLVSHRARVASVKFTGRAEPASAASASPTGFKLEHCSHDGTYDWDTGRGMLAKMAADMRVVLEAQMTGVVMKHETTMTVSVRRLDR